MDYISCESAAKKMSVSARRIQQMCKQKEIVGAIKDGRNWLIPDNAILSPKKPLPIGVSDFKSATEYSTHSEPHRPALRATYSII